MCVSSDKIIQLDVMLLAELHEVAICRMCQRHINILKHAKEVRNSIHVPDDGMYLMIKLEIYDFLASIMHMLQEAHEVVLAFPVKVLCWNTCKKNVSVVIGELAYVIKLLSKRELSHFTLMCILSSPLLVRASHEQWLIASVLEVFVQLYSNGCASSTLNTTP